jgi:hypothetical protein
MATLPSADDNARAVLKIFRHFNARPGHTLGGGSLSAIGLKMGMTGDDIVAGVNHGSEIGWFKQGPNSSVALTDAGFGEM